MDSIKRFIVGLKLVIIGINIVAIMPVSVSLDVNYVQHHTEEV